MNPVTTEANTISGPTIELKKAPTRHVAIPTLAVTTLVLLLQHNVSHAQCVKTNKAGLPVTGSPSSPAFNPVPCGYVNGNLSNGPIYISPANTVLARSNCSINYNSWKNNVKNHRSSNTLQNRRNVKGSLDGLNACYGPVYQQISQ